MTPEAQKLFDDHQGYARAVARVRHSAMPWRVRREDVEQAALIGLWHAAESYDPTRGMTFKSHAGHRCAWAIQDALREDDSVSRQYRKWGRLCDETEERVMAEDGRCADEQDIADALGMSEQHYRLWRLAKAMMSPADLDAPLPRLQIENRDATLLDIIPAKDGQYKRVDNRDECERLLRFVPKRHAECVRQVWFEHKTMEVVAREFKPPMCESRVSQLCREARVMILRALEKRGDERVRA